MIDRYSFSVHKVPIIERATALLELCVSGTKTSQQQFNRRQFTNIKIVVAMLSRNVGLTVKTTILLFIPFTNLLFKAFAATRMTASFCFQLLKRFFINFFEIDFKTFSFGFPVFKL
jgi:hypothetical protein